MRARTSWHARTSGKALALLIGVMLAYLGLVLVSPTAVPTAAATEGTVGEGIHVPIPGYGETWLGAFEVPTDADGALSWCIQMWVAPGVGAAPVAMSAYDDPVLAWLIETYADPTNALDQAAIAYTVHQRAEVPGVVAGGDVDQAKLLLAEATPVEVRDRAAAMLATATAQAGPYQVQVPSVQATDLRFGSITNLGVTSAVGAWVTGLDGTIELLEHDAAGELVPTNRAVFDLNANQVADPGESNVWSASAPNGPLTVDYAATGIGDVLVRATFAGLATARLALYGMDNSRQDNLSLSPSISGDSTGLTTDVVKFTVANGFQVTGSSAVQHKVLDPGNPICDSLDVQAESGYTWLTVDGAPVSIPLVAALWRVGTQPVTPDDSAPRDAALLTEVHLDATGPGTYHACADQEAVADTDPGILTWQWRTDGDAMPATHRPLLLAEWQDTFGLSAESSSLRHTPQIVTSLSVRATSGGLRLVDDLWAEGYPADHGDFTGGAGFGGDQVSEQTELWFFAEGAPVVDAGIADGSATLIGTIVRDAVNGYQSLSSPRFGWPQTGTDSDGDGVLDPLPGTVAARTLFLGDDRTQPISTSVADLTEQFTVTAVAAQTEPLSITTALQSTGEVEAEAELTLRDATDVTGTLPEDGIVLTNDLYRWTGDDPICSPETLIAAGDPITVTAPGQVLSTQVSLTAEAGVTYGYVETARNTAGQVVHRGECGADTETVRVPAPPMVQTSARTGSDQPTVGDELWDTITWQGDIPSGSTSTAELFYVPAGQDLTCTAGTLIWTSQPVTMNQSPGSSNTDHYRTTAPGTYGFVETTRDRQGTVISHGTCGDADETIIVAAPTVPTRLATTGTVTDVLFIAASLALIVGTVLRSRRRGRRPQLSASKHTPAHSPRRG